MLNTYARLGVQPALYTRTPTSIEQWISGGTFEWVLPVGRKNRGGKNINEVGFDDYSLPVKLAVKEANKKTAGIWYRNKRDSSPLTNRQSPVVLYFRKSYRCFLVNLYTDIWLQL